MEVYLDAFIFRLGRTGEGMTSTGNGNANGNGQHPGLDLDAGVKCVPRLLALLKFSDSALIFMIRAHLMHWLILDVP